MAVKKPKKQLADPKLFPNLDYAKWRESQWDNFGPRWSFSNTGPLGRARKPQKPKDNKKGKI